MIRMISKEELEKILEDHKHYLAKDVCGWETMKADLSEADLYGADLTMTNLSEADLYIADLIKARLYKARLCGVNLSGADLFEADLCRANLYRADLSGAHLVGANLSWADLRRANLSGADLYGANLSGAKLIGTNTYEAVFCATTVSDSACPLRCPEEGSFIGWKKAFVKPDSIALLKAAEVIIKLQIPERAKRSSATGRKCRCNEARVLDIQSLDGESLPKETIAQSQFDYTFTYEVDKIVKVNNFDGNRWNECSAGIHFFITRQEAVDYDFF